MKKEQKRYYLIEYCGPKIREYESKEKLDSVLDEIRKYNNRKNEKYIIGNMTYERVKGKYVLTAHLYRKMMAKSTITDIDNYTSRFDEKGLIKELYPKLLTANPDNNKNHLSFYPDLSIAYFEDKNKNEKDLNDNLIRRIKYIPILYEDDLKYLNMNYISKCIAAHCSYDVVDFDFFEGILEEFGKSRNCDDAFDNLIRTINRVKYEGYSPDRLYYDTLSLYKGLIYERSKDGSILRDENGKYQISRRRARDFGFYVKNYHNNIHKIATSYTYGDSKTKLEEMKRIREEILKNQGEQLTMNLK